jgi:uncharacterized protein (UPF0147 family)
MDEAIKSGKEMLDEFFLEITQIPNVDKRIAESLAGLYKQQKFTDKQIANALQALEEEKGDDKN